MSQNIHDPFKTPDWRWQRAIWLHEQGKYSRRGRDDAYILQAKSFLAKYKKADNYVLKETLSNQEPGIYYAKLIKEREDVNDRYIIEARLLAEEPLENIAKKQNTSLEVILWYERLFFDVKDKLDSRDWIINRVLGPSFCKGIRRRDFDLLLKLYALIGGEFVLDALMQDSSITIPKPKSKQEVDGFWQADQKDNITRQAALSIRCLPVITETQGIILDSYQKMLEFEKESANSSDAQGLIVKNIQSALASVPFKRSKAATEELGRGPNASVYIGGLEPRANELLMIGLNEKIEVNHDFDGFNISEVPVNK
jgi:hypothetical protein